MAAEVLTAERLAYIEQSLSETGWDGDELESLFLTVRYLRDALREIQRDAGPGVGVRARDRAKHALYPSRGTTQWKRAR